MKAIIISFCLICAISANPITFGVIFEPHEVDVNSTSTLLVSQSSGNDTSEVQSSEENHSSESQSSESVESSDNTSEESDSESDESNETNLLVETRDDSMGSEENIRKSWVRVFTTVARDSSAEDNSTEATLQPQVSLNKLTEKHPAPASTLKTFKQSSKRKFSLLQKATATSDSSSESADSTGGAPLITFTADSSQSLSSESNETEASDSASDSSQSSESQEDSNGSDSAELSPIKDCVNGTQSCESDEYAFQDIGDDAHYTVDNFMVPDEDDRELSLRR